jgi:hypothetical protein
VEKRFTYTVTPKNMVTDTLTYDRPADLSAAIRAIRETVSKAGGTVTGTETAGTFIAADYNGTYTVTGTALIFTVTHPVEKSLAQGPGPATRSANSAYNFAFPKPADMARAVADVRAQVLAKKGTFIGDETGGTFKVSGINGSYTIKDPTATVTILDKPFVVPNTMIEKEVKGYFGAK